MAIRSQWASRLRAPTRPASEPDTPPESGGLVLAPLTEREFPIACCAWEEADATIQCFSGSADSAGLAELRELRDALVLALDNYDPLERGLRRRWSRLARRRHTLTAVLARYGVEPDAPWTLPCSPADPRNRAKAESAVGFWLASPC